MTNLSDASQIKGAENNSNVAYFNVPYVSPGRDVTQWNETPTVRK